MDGKKQHFNVIGAGSWGTALAIQLARNGATVRMWDVDADLVGNLALQRENSRYLPGVRLPDTLSPVAHLEEMLWPGAVLLLVVPSHAFEEVLRDLSQKGFLAQIRGVCWATKGLDAGHGGLLHQTVSGFLSDAVPRGIISGPSFAKEVAIGLPTAITVASPDQDFVRFLGEAFHSTTFRPYLSDDLAGVEVGGAIKNVLAVAAGISDGMRLGANARAGLITRGLAEMTRLGVALGGRQETFQGLSGLGDLVLTCTDDQSRNRRLGLMLGKGASLSEALQTINQTVEGIRTAKEVFMLAGSMGVEMPICEQVYRVLHEDQKAHQALTDLLRRPIKNEALF